MTTEASRAAKARYDEKTAVYISLKLNKNTDQDLIDMLEQCDNKQALIKQALRAMKREEK